MILDKIKPTEQEEKELFVKIEAFIKKLQKLFPKTEIEVGGSVAKGTWLKNTFDIDIFIKCKTEEEILDLKEKMLTLNPELMKGSREYYQIKEDLLFEVVPVLNIKDEKDAKNITDISPLHSIWVRNHADHKLKDEIRLCKQFMKGQKVYGAESYIKGFSGYCVEILVIQYGSFEKLLKAKWKEKEVIDPSKHHKDVFFEVNSSKLTSPIIIIDPVQAGRNAAAALSKEKLELFQKAAKAYLKKPSDDFFEKKDIEKVEDAKNIYICVEPKEGKRDVVGCQVEKAFEHFGRELVSNDFEIVESDWDLDQKLFYFKVKKEELPEEQEITGPPLKIEKHVLEFKKKYSDTFEKGGKIYAKVKRKHTKARDLIKKHKYLKEKLESFKLC